MLTISISTKHRTSVFCFWFLKYTITAFYNQRLSILTKYWILNVSYFLLSQILKSYKWRMINVQVFPIKQPGLQLIWWQKYQSDCPTLSVQVLEMLVGDTYPSLLDNPLQHSPIYTATSTRGGSPWRSQVTQYHSSQDPWVVRILQTEQVGHQNLPPLAVWLILNSCNQWRGCCTNVQEDAWYVQHDYLVIINTNSVVFCPPTLNTFRRDSNLYIT